MQTGGKYAKQAPACFTTNRRAKWAAACLKQAAAYCNGRAPVVIGGRLFGPPLFQKWSKTVGRLFETGARLFHGLANRRDKLAGQIGGRLLQHAAAYYNGRPPVVMGGRLFSNLFDSKCETSGTISHGNYSRKCTFYVFLILTWILLTIRYKATAIPILKSQSFEF